MIKGYKFQEGSKLTFKQELDSHYTFHSYDEHWNAIWCNVVKSVIVGTVYYAAVKVEEFETILKDNRTKKKKTQIIAVVGKVYKRKSDEFDYFVEFLEESQYPQYFDCPECILNLLTETDDKWALQWRFRCRETLMFKYNTPSLKDLPYGSIIQVPLKDGGFVKLKKMPPNNQFKTYWWLDESTNCYCSKRRLGINYEIIRIGDLED